MKLELSKTLNFPTGVLALAGRTDGSRLYVTGMDGTVTEIDVAADTRTDFEARHKSYAAGCVLLPQGNTLISSGYDGHLHWHDVPTRRPIRTVSAHDFWSWQLALSPDGRRVASVTGQYLVGGEKYEPAATEKATVKIYDTESGELVHALSHAPPVQCVAFSPDGQYLAAGNMMGSIAIWETRTGRLAAEFKTSDFTSWGIIKSPHYIGGIYGLSFAPDGQSLVLVGMGPMTDPMAGNGKMTWQRFDWRESPAKMLDQIHSGDHGTGLMEAINFSPDGRTFVMAGRQAQGSWNAAIFSAEDGKLLASLDTKSRITRALFAADGTTLFLAGAIGQGARKDGKWADYGRVYIVRVLAS